MDYGSRRGQAETGRLAFGQQEMRAAKVDSVSEVDAAVSPKSGR